MNRLCVAFLVVSTLSAATVRGKSSVRGSSSVNGTAGTPTIIYHPFIIGQSLARGSQGSPSLSTQPGLYNNLKFTGGLRYPVTHTAFNSLIEPSEETIASGFAAQVSQMSITGGIPYPPASVMTSWGVDGAAYAALAKGTTPYNDSLSGVTSAEAIYPSPILSVPAILVVHGESNGDTALYGTNLVQWQSDYETDVKAITLQSGIIPFFFTQIATAAGTPFLGMLPNYEAAPTTQILVGPKYFLEYQAAGTHLINTSYRTLGEYYGKAFYKVIVLGQSYSPLRPLTITRVGATVTVQMTGQVGDLVNGCTAVGAVVTDPGQLGFEWFDDSASATVSSAVVSDAVNGIVTVTLSGTPTGTNKALRYAYSGIGRAGPPTTGKRGCIRDSDTTTGILDGVALQNWLVHFNKSSN